jgi:hypothetical protein
MAAVKLSPRRAAKAERRRTDMESSLEQLGTDTSVKKECKNEEMD